jgi:hypothetical protein
MRGNGNMTHKGRPRTDPDIVGQIEVWAGDGFGPGSIREKLLGDDRFRSRAPSLRTVSQYAGRIRKKQLSPYWNLEDSPEGAALIMPALREKIEHSFGRERRLTVDEARWLARIRTAAPNIPIASAFVRARAMTWVNAGDEGEAEESLQAFLAYEPWTDGAKAYIDAFERGWIKTLLFDPLTSEFGSGHGAVISISHASEGADSDDWRAAPGLDQ